MDPSDVKNLLTCEFCSKTFESPVILPCGDTICRKDLRGLFVKENEPNVIYCYFCSDEHHIPRQGFPANKIINALLAKNLQSLDLGHKYEKAKANLDLLSAKLNELDQITSGPSDYLASFFQNIQNDMEVSKDRAKIMIDSIYDKMTGDLDDFRTKCAARLKKEGLKSMSTIDENFVASSNQMLAKWHQELSSLVVDEKKWREIYLEADAFEKKLEVYIDKVKSELLLKTRIKFDPREIKPESKVFGVLKMHVKLLFLRHFRLNVIYIK
jgi:hypothetical protein